MSDEPVVTTSLREVERLLEHHRRGLAGYCYRMLGSAFDADDAVQETLLRAWRGYDHFEGRAALRSWLYRIATNVCLDLIASRKRRGRPTDLAYPEVVDAANLATRPAAEWVEPVADERLIAPADDPAEQATTRQTIRLAFVAALQHLPARQRAVLILREVLAWQATEVAAALDTTVPSVNSALQRARATLDAQRPAATDAYAPLDEGQRALLTRYVDAFERYDIDALTALFHDEATLSMPPYAIWRRGRAAITEWLLGPGAPCRGSRLIATTANGAPAFAQYRPSGPEGEHEAWALQVLEIADGKVVALNSFLDVEGLFPRWGLPLRLPAER
jgi:RNA polymerase sigma-70 factor (ECF subfamily)